MSRQPFFSRGRSTLHCATKVVIASTLVWSAIAASRSVNDGVYTKEQAARGQTAYNAQCVRCHGEALLGGESAPALVDKEFLDGWKGKSVGQLVELTRTTMPSDGPGKLSRKMIVDIATYLLSSNNFPAGKTELDTDEAVLNEITIDPK